MAAARHEGQVEVGAGIIAFDPDNPRRMKLSSFDPEDERRRWYVVRCDTLETVRGLILCASEETGLCLLRVENGGWQEYHFGPNGCRLLPVL